MARLLVIDDEPIYHKMIASALEGQGHHLDFAADGEKGMETAYRISPDLIITDVMMPGISGYEVTRLLRRQPQFAHTPILVLTAQTGLQDKLKSFEAGADDHLTKPFEPAELVARVAALLRRAESSHTADLSPAKERGRFVAVHSLRGGTGCSSLAVNLAVSLSALWKTPTVLLDLTMTAGQVALMLNRTLKRTWADVANYGPAELDMDVLQSILARHESGLSFIAAPTYPAEAELIKGETLEAALNLLSASHNYLVADLPHDFSDIAIHALDVADVILVVASPDMASIRAVAASLDTYTRLGYPPEKIRLLLNWTFPRRGLAKEKIETAFSVPILANIPYAADLFVDAINYGQPFVLEKPGDPVSGLVEDLAFLLSKDEHKKAKPANPTEAWQRVYKRYQERRK